ncbi:hypothetical protein O1L60_37710 [Streptomyces diastatochromogenes]|nr:hypothetical protein [Streptomyces diastatochromogenes]
MTISARPSAVGTQGSVRERSTSGTIVLPTAYGPVGAGSSAGRTTWSVALVRGASGVAAAATPARQGEGTDEYGGAAALVNRIMRAR